VDFVIPGTTMLRSIWLFASRIAEAVMAGRGMKESADVGATTTRRRRLLVPWTADALPAEAAQLHAVGSWGVAVGS
jgi:hypothetical protein